MIVVRKVYTRILEGYLRAAELDKKLRSDWETILHQKLLREYNSRLESWETNEKLRAARENEITQKEQAAHRWKVITLSLTLTFMFVCIFYLLIEIIAGYILPQENREPSIVTWRLPFLIICCLNPAIISFASFVVWVVKLSKAKSVSQERIPPQPKPQMPRVEDLMPRVSQRWLERLALFPSDGQIILEPNSRNGERHFGTEGQVRLLSVLRSYIHPRSLLIHELMISPNSDIDLIVVNSTGIWILESKYFSGHVSYRDGQWRHLTQTVGANGQLYWEEKYYESPLEIDQQWKHQYEIVVSRVFRELVKRYSWLQPAVKGGIVFTHPKCSFDIVDCPVSWGTPEWWGETVSQARIIPEFSFERQLEILDVLLGYSRKYQQLPSESAIKLANTIYDQIVTEISRE